MPWHDGLTGTALEIARTTNSPLRVMAGPGTGKSYAMKRRLMRLLEEGVAPQRILVVTFTRTAAADLVKEIGELEVEGCGDIRAGTLHSYCFGVLAKRHVLEFTRRVPRPLVAFPDKGILQFEAAPLLQDIGQAEDFGDKRDRTQRVRAYEADWARLQTDTPGRPTDPVDVRFRDELVRWLTFHEAMLIGELVPLALGYLRNNPSCVERGSFDHVLVDEYQDLNKAEQVLLDQLVERCQYAVFGDQDQSIYSFRWAHPEGITQFHADRPGTANCNLSECQRCPTRVVAMAASLVGNNHPAGGPARLNPKAGKPEGEVHIVQWNHLGDESEGLTRFVGHLVEKRGYRPRDVLVLSPRRLLGYGIRDALRKASIPTHSFYHEEALEEDEAKRAFALLTLLASPKDRVALRYWLGDDSPTWNARGYASLRSHWRGFGGVALGSPGGPPGRHVEAPPHRAAGRQVQGVAHPPCGARDPQGPRPHRRLVPGDRGVGGGTAWHRPRWQAGRRGGRRSVGAAPPEHHPAGTARGRRVRPRHEPAQVEGAHQQGGDRRRLHAGADPQPPH